MTIMNGKMQVIGEVVNRERLEQDSRKGKGSNIIFLVKLLVTWKEAMRLHWENRSARWWKLQKENC